MGTFANEDVLYTNNPSPSTGTGLLQMRQNQKAIKELVGASAPVTLEIVDGSITPTSAFVLVDTEGQAAADDLTVINVVVDATNTLHDGMLLYLQAADSGRTVTVVNSSSANGIQTVDGGNITLNTKTWCILQLRSGTWHEISSTQAQTIDGVEFNGTAGITHATTCDTAAATAAKTATLDGFALIAGAEVTVKFTNGNTASNPTLNISNTGAAPILYQGVAITDASIGANTVCRLYYDGSAWNIVGIVTAPATTSSLGTARLATPAEVQAGAAAAGSVEPAVLDVNDARSLPKATDALFGLGRSATAAEAAAGATSGTGPAFVTPEQLGARAAYLVETWHSGAEWYRKWSDGWIEQGGILHNTTAGWHPITLQKQYSDTSYTIHSTLIAIDGSNIGYAAYIQYNSKKPTGFNIYSDAHIDNMWYACGY